MKILDTNKDDKYVDGRFYYFSYKGFRIVNIDLSNLNNEKESIDVIKKISNIYATHKFIPLTGRGIIDLSNSKTTTKIINTLKVFSSTSNTVDTKGARTGIIGLTKLQKIFINAMDRLADTDLRAFETKEEALEWVILK